MSGFSRSSKANHYKSGHSGSGHYKKSGLFGKLMNFAGSRSGSDRYYNNAINQTAQSNSPKVICMKCSSQIPAGSKFCNECGTKASN